MNKLSAKAAKASGAKTNKKPGSLVKTVVVENVCKWLQPPAGAQYTISEDVEFPKIAFEFETDNPGPFEWNWTIVWPAAVSGLRESSKPGGSLKNLQPKGILYFGKKTMER